MNKFFLLILVSLFLETTFGQESLIVGYLPTYRFKTSSEIDFCKLTHVNICFANPNSKGELLAIDSLAEMMTIIRESNPNIKINLSLAGGALINNQAAYWRKFINIKTNRPIIISNILAYIEKYNFDGIDVDLEWENVTKGYSPFVIALKDSLLLRNKLLTAALPGVKKFKNITDEALKAFDYINIMAYDERGSWNPKNAGPHSSMEFAKTSIYYWKDIIGIPANKLTLGLPFYAYDFTNPKKTKPVLFKELIAMNPDYAKVDSVGLIFYNGIPTIKEKVEYATKNVAGVMIWELGQDSTKEFSLLSAVHHKIKELGANNSIEDCDILEKDLIAFGSEKLKKEVIFETNIDKKYFTIQAKNLSKIKVELYNKKGRKIHLKSYGKKKKKYFKIRKLRKGIYTIKVSKGKFHFLKKLTIEKKR